MHMSQHYFFGLAYVTTLDKSNVNMIFFFLTYHSKAIGLFFDSLVKRKIRSD